jgi:rhodanese-related sulfurtransferase
MRPFLLVLFSSLMLCCTTNVKGQNKLDAAAFEAKIKSLPDVQLIDVRTPQEYVGGHLEGAKNINWNDSSFEQNIQTLDKKRPVLVYCAVGGRSGKAANRLAQLGFSEVYDLSGGFNGWKTAGRKVANQ